MPVIFGILLMAFDFLLKRSEILSYGALTAADFSFRLIPSSFAPCISYTQAIEDEIEMWFRDNSVLFLVLCKGQGFFVFRSYIKCTGFLFFFFL